MNPNLTLAYREMWSRWTDFEGRTSIARFWWAMLANVLIAIVLFTAMLLADGNGFARVAVGAIAGGYGLAVFVPVVAMSVRRLHDWNRSGWLVLTGLVPIVLLVLLAQPGTPGPNRFGLPQPPGIPIPTSRRVRASWGFTLGGVTILALALIFGGDDQVERAGTMVVVGLLFTLFWWMKERNARTRNP